MKYKSKIGILILAAGSSSRLGYPKQLVKFKGKLLLQRIIDIAEKLPVTQKVLVLGANSNSILEAIDVKDLNLIINKDWKEGMASSIRAGLYGLLEKQSDLEHVLILLSDQPLLRIDQIESLIQQQLNNEVQAIFSEYDGITGVPAIFSKELFSELQKLEGDQGAKKLIYQKNLEFKTVKFEKGNFDVDTREDVELLKELEK